MKDGLERFLDAQKNTYETALGEIRAGCKRSHWMWYIFPQVRGLGRSGTAQYYAIRDLDEAKAYLQEPTLRRRLLEISQALLELETGDASRVMGWPDDLKLKSSMTLFDAAEPECRVFQGVLDKYFHGEKDQKTLEILADD